MLILTNENKTFDLDLVGKSISKTYFSVFDFSNKEEPDYLFKPLAFLENFESLGIGLRIGNNEVKIPSSWSIVLGDPETGDIELIPIEDLNNRDFNAFIFNPITGFYPRFEPVSLVDLYMDMSWSFPKLEHHNFLVLPLNNSPAPDCILLINEKDQKKIPPLELSYII